MPTPIVLYSINHKKGDPIVGGVAKEFVVGEDDEGALLPGYCDMIAPYHIWYKQLVPAIVGFHGYRKHMNFRDAWDNVLRTGPQLAPGWEAAEHNRFLQYQRWLVEWDAREITHDWMQKHDVLTVEPFKLPAGLGMAEDYALSRSALDWGVLEGILRQRGFDNAALDTPYIRPMHFVMRDHTFCRWMRFWDDIRRELEPAIFSDDAKSEVAKTRALAFLSERIWSLWLDRAQLRVKTFPLMICWEAQ